MTSRHGYGIDQGLDGNAYGTWGGEKQLTCEMLRYMLSQTRN